MTRLPSIIFNPCSSADCGASWLQQHDYEHLDSATTMAPACHAVTPEPVCVDSSVPQGDRWNMLAMSTALMARLLNLQSRFVTACLHFASMTDRL